MDRLSLKGQVILTLILILLTSWLATALSFGGIVLWQRATSPTHGDLEANITLLITQQGLAILRPSEQATVEYRLRGLSYQVVDVHGRVIYGSLPTRIVPNQMDLLRRINTTDIGGQFTVTPFNILRSSITKYFPIVDRGGVMHGAVIVQYPVFGVSTHPSAQGWMTLVSYMIPFLPFLYFCLFSYLFAMRFGKRINKPLQVLARGAQRIQQQDLDFIIEPAGPNEIGQVLIAFENMRAALKESLVRQWQMEDERRHMISAISHDLRTPLTIIRGHVERLLDGGMAQPDRLASHLQTVMHSTNRVTQLLEDMQEVTDVENPDFSLHRVAVDVHQYVTDWTRDFELLAARAGIKLSVAFHDGRQDPNPLSIDPKRISQVLDNIASNSVRFTPPGGTITIRTDVSDTTFACEITDTGPGFTNTDLQHMFDQFYQGDTSRSTGGHSGLGLYTAKKLVEKHGGTIAAGNLENGGAFVRFVIPSSL